MRILFAIKGMNDAKGGAERVLADVSGALADRGHDVSLLTFDDAAKDTFYPLSPRINRIGLASGDTNRSATLRETLVRLPRLRTAVRNLKPDVVVAFMHSMFVPAALACAGLGVKIVGSEHIVPMHYRNRPLERLLLNVSAPLIDRYTVLSDTIRTGYSSPIARKMAVIPNPVRQAAVWAEAGADVTVKRVLSVGRLEPQKDYGTLIEAFARLAPRFPDWKLDIVGDGSEREKLSSLVASYGLGERISLTSAVKDIGPVYQSSHLFVMPSRYESFGLATAEAMAHALPVVGFADCPGTNELIEDGVNGLLASPSSGGRAEALVGALDRLMAEPELRRRFGRNGVETAGRYALDTVADRWEEVLQEVCLDKA